MEPSPELRLMHRRRCSDKIRLSRLLPASAALVRFWRAARGTSFVGREAELDRLDHLAASGRLVTLAGLGASASRGSPANGCSVPGARSFASGWIFQGTPVGEIALRRNDQVGLARTTRRRRWPSAAVVAASTGLPGRAGDPRQRRRSAQ
ncbi:MAG: hypothetical protein IPM11_11275 [Micropruina sp.]|nr:hypothetical protein [Micropruina sp.]